MAESGPQSQPDEILVDLLIKQVTEGLSPAEQRALDVLDTAVASAFSSDFERAAAAVALAGSAGAESLPSPLRARLEEQAQAFFAADRGARGPRAAARGGTAGWWAAAACLVLAVFGWLRSPQPTVAPVASTPTTTSPAVAPPAHVPAAAPTLAEQRAALLARPDSLKVTLGATKDPGAAGMTGDVVWDPATQQGFLRFVGLRPNDPQAHQYQLWIFDGERDQRYPVDGGVFNVPANDTEVLVPIHAAVPVRAAKTFAVTIEKPGGVVVSGREHVVALGQAS
jgi:hypothetical protein